jgi:hypothetical protein
MSQSISCLKQIALSPLIIMVRESIYLLPQGNSKYAPPKFLFYFSIVGWGTNATRRNNAGSRPDEVIELCYFT